MIIYQEIISEGILVGNDHSLDEIFLIKKLQENTQIPLDLIEDITLYKFVNHDTLQPTIGVKIFIKDHDDLYRAQMEILGINETTIKQIVSDIVIERIFQAYITL